MNGCNIWLEYILLHLLIPNLWVYNVGIRMDDYTRSNLRNGKIWTCANLLEWAEKIKHHNTGEIMKQTAFYLPLKDLKRVSPQHGLQIFKGK